MQRSGRGFVRNGRPLEVIRYKRENRARHDEKYSVDVDHAGRVRDTAIRIFSAAAPVWG